MALYAFRRSWTRLDLSDRLKQLSCTGGTRVVDRYARWGIFLELEVPPSPSDGPRYALADLVDPLRGRIRADKSSKAIDRCDASLE